MRKEFRGYFAVVLGVQKKMREAYRAYDERFFLKRDNDIR